MGSTDAAPSRSKHWLAAVLALALLARLGWGLSRPTDDATIDLLPDQRGYLELARNLLDGAGLNCMDEARFGDQVLYAARTPGYPAFVALCGGSVRIVRIAQALLDTSTALAVYLLACRLLLRQPAPLLAATLVAFNPFLVYFSALLLTETLYTAMLAWGMVLLLHRRMWALGAVLLALGILVRPSGLGLPVVLSACAVVAREPLRPAGSLQRPGTLWSRAALAGIIAAILTIAALFPWAWRNDRVLGRWLWSTSNDGITAYDGFHPGATGASDQSFVAHMPEVKNMSELERSDYFAAEARRFVRENPAEAARLTLVKVMRTWSPVPLSEEFGRPLYRVVALLFALPFDILIIVGLFTRRLGRAAAILLLLPALYFTAVHALSVGSLRYRIPAEPPLALLAAVAAARLLALQTKKERTPPS